MIGFRQFSFKKFGYLDFNKDLVEQLAHFDGSKFIKIFYVKASGRAVIDFKEYLLEADSLFFINAGQFFEIDNSCSGTMLYYNRDFYCIEMHDKEVACDGILFHNVYEIPVVSLKDSSSAAVIRRIFEEIKSEIESGDSSMEEMLRLLLKQVIIRSTRIWKSAHQIVNEEARREVEFTRVFSQLVEWNYRKFHTVAEYAGLLHISPKALNKRITRYSDTTPNEIIKNRVILEAKRLLAHTRFSVKEIGYKLGYEDPNYFVRLFTRHTLISPVAFRQQYQLAQEPQ